MNGVTKAILAVLFGAALAVFFAASALDADCGQCGSEGKHEHPKTPATVKPAECRTGTCTLADAKCTEGCKAAKATETKEAEINVHAVEVLRRSGVRLHILDARSGTYDDGRRIPGAKSLAAGTKENEVAKVIGTDKEVLVITYCSSTTCPASRMLATHLKSLGYTNVLEFPGGIKGWAEAGYPVVKAEGK